MKLLICACLVFAVALGDFLVRGLGAYEEASIAHAELLQRHDQMRDLRAELQVVGYAESEALTGETERLAELVKTWRSTLLGTGGNAPPSLDTLLSNSRIEAFEKGGDLHESIRAQAAVSVRAAPLLARLVEAVVRAGLKNVEALELTDAGAEHPVAHVSNAVQIESQLIVTGDLDAVLGCLESLAPGSDRPLLTVTQATLRRIEPDRWGSLEGLTGPPVRLTATVAAIYATDEATRSGSDEPTDADDAGGVDEGGR